MNVTCRLKAWEDAYWYRLLNPDGWDFPATTAYVSAGETHELNPGQPYPIPECKNIGCRRKAGQAAAEGRSRRRRGDGHPVLAPSTGLSPAQLGAVA